ncbi:trypsin-like peptidase domain-containing protein [Proteus mirabilis]|uniref:S1 family peptidase n=1 Tax=Proteus mirabilis TaxID=584 RepID=UPI0010724C3B|nr:trypsin-like peptidase domain-containing protein [Proteus mirabilis]EGT3589381.1 serine protease [Proteus mirabilis]MBG5978068.1 trypsin-like peptidase domain-containing protein [Proteus mirabilis]MCD4631656.1 trypsin-like peptidase domain-containing protein [Proteus mirabilis]MCU0099685.1 trypsin-like peptidase domain-containing protein [Proteus mirabilis]MCU0139403.1 trypsin-like peptidase domain-containing protein [Proteus mirabilis]
MKRPSNPIEILVHSTVRIECLKDSKSFSSGTGYLFGFLEQESGESCPCIVTNKHVLEGSEDAIFHLTRQDDNGDPDLGNYDAIGIKEVKNYVIYHPDKNIDLAVIPIGMILNSAEASGKRYAFTYLNKDFIISDELLGELSPMEDIIMIGYPNGLWDTVHNLPIIRKGVTATDPKLNLNGKSEFLIDAAVYPGSSGSPVLLANIGRYIDKHGNICIGNRIALLGTVYLAHQSSVKTISNVKDEENRVIGMFPNNLGYVIKASELLAFDDAISDFIEKHRDAKGLWDKSDNAPQSRNSPCHCGSGKRYKECHGKLN